MNETYDDFYNLEELQQLACDHDAMLSVQVFGDKEKWKIKFVCKELNIKAQKTGKYFEKTSEILIEEIKKQMTGNGI